MAGTHQPMEESHPGRTLEESDQGRIGIKVLLPLQPVLECRTGHTRLLSKGSLAAVACLELEDQLGRLSAVPARRDLCDGLGCCRMILTHGSVPVRVFSRSQHWDASQARLSPTDPGQS